MADPISLESIEKAFNYTFKAKPLLIGGAAMEFYGLRERGDDIDLVVSEEDYRNLESMYPRNMKDIHGDLGIVKDGYETWRTIMLFGYVHLSEDAVEHDGVIVAGLEKLLLLKALGMDEEKYFKDLRLIVRKIIDKQYE